MDEQETVGFIGVGNMGYPMARNLLKAGHALRIYDLAPQKGAGLEELGAIMVASPAATVEPGGMVFSMVSDDAAVEQIVCGPSGLLQQLGPHGVHVGMSTISLAGTRRIAALYAEHGCSYVTATVSGRPDVAALAQLSVYYAGPEHAKARALPWLSAMGARLCDLGTEQTAAMGCKLAFNFKLMADIWSNAYALAFAAKCGVEPATFMQILRESPIFGGGKILEYGDRIAADHHLPALFPVALGAKDVQLMLDGGAEIGVALPAAEYFLECLHQAEESGWADEDWGVVGRVILQRAGLNLRETAGSTPSAERKQRC